MALDMIEEKADAQNLDAKEAALETLTRVFATLRPQQLHVEVLRRTLILVAHAFDPLSTTLDPALEDGCITLAKTITTKAFRPGAAVNATVNSFIFDVYLLPSITELLRFEESKRSLCAGKLVAELADASPDVRHWVLRAAGDALSMTTPSAIFRVLAAKLAETRPLAQKYFEEGANHFLELLAVRLDRQPREVGPLLLSLAGDEELPSGIPRLFEVFSAKSFDITRLDNESRLLLERFLMRFIKSQVEDFSVLLKLNFTPLTPESCVQILRELPNLRDKTSRQHVKTFVRRLGAACPQAESIHPSAVLDSPFAGHFLASANPELSESIYKYLEERLPLTEINQLKALSASLARKSTLNLSERMRVFLSSTPAALPVIRALAGRCDGFAYTVITSLEATQLLVRVLLGPSTLFTALTPAVTYRQRIFSLLFPPLRQAGNRGALLELARLAPFEAVRPYVPYLLSIAVDSKDEAEGRDFYEVVRRLVTEAREEAQLDLVGLVETLLIRLSRATTPLDVRLAVECLEHAGRRVNASSRRIREAVIKGLRPILDHPKRDARKAAVRCINLWYLL
eukprot:TRINITY_DN10110_c0_g1_i4.p1 TRINITY_DN10110_c0_g1~~TRINITY_DN10110_c0_g1_i4.p1  ORF type:complete len:571 (+),score=89.56 TRINITY_DN10110_c0_g1_i4:715-2427(+)